MKADRDMVKLIMINDYMILFSEINTRASVNTHVKKKKCTHNTHTEQVILKQSSLIKKKSFHI